MLTSSESKKIFISINTKDSNFDNNEIQKEIVNELSLKFPNKLIFITNESEKSTFLDIFYQNIPFYLQGSDYAIIQDRIFNLDSILTRNHRSLFSPDSDIKKGIILILRVTPLAQKDVDQLRKVVEELYSIAKAADADIARLGEERIIVTPSSIKIWKPEYDLK